MLWRKRAGLFLLYDLILEIYATNALNPKIRSVSSSAQLAEIQTPRGADRGAFAPSAIFEQFGWRENTRTSYTCHVCINSFTVKC